MRTLVKIVVWLIVLTIVLDIAWPQSARDRAAGARGVRPQRPPVGPDEATGGRPAMKELRNVVVGIVVIVVAVNVLTGNTAGVASFVIGLLSDVTRSLQTVLIAVALPALLLGGLIYVSPWQRDLAVRLMVGAVVVLAVAVLGPLVLHWLQGQLAAYGTRLFGGRS